MVLMIVRILLGVSNDLDFKDKIEWCSKLNQLEELLAGGILF